MGIFGFRQKNLITGFLATILVVNLMCPLLSFAELDAQGHALLVGCTQYEHLFSDYWLEGPVNDVELMYEILTREMFHFKPEQVTRLAGWPENEEQRPTRANIEREFKRLAKVAGQGDQVVILLAGHGSQQPADDDSNELESDGLDEIFLPADVKDWDFNTGRARC